jgi:precorrin-2/cobalt-factor-2 C20-methyltransferase
MYAWQPGRLFGIGVGPGDPELLTLKAHRILTSAQVVAYPCSESGVSLARSIVAGYLQPHHIEVPFSLPFSLRHSAQSHYQDAANAIAAYLNEGQDVVVLCEGDPFFYGTFMYLFQNLAAQFPTELVPGISSVMAGASCLGTPLAFRNDVFMVLSAVLPIDTLRSRLAVADAAVILKLGRHFSKVYQVLTDLNLVERSHYIEHATCLNQRVLPLDAVKPDQVPYFSMIMIPSQGNVH